MAVVATVGGDNVTNGAIRWVVVVVVDERSVDDFGSTQRVGCRFQVID